MIFSCPLRVLAAVLISMASLSVFAQAPGPKDIDRDRFLSEIRNYKHEVLVKSLELTKEQQREFFPIYDELDNRLQEINTETRELEKRVAVDQTATDTEIEAAASMVYSQKAILKWSITKNSNRFLLPDSSWGFAALKKFLRRNSCVITIV